MYFWVSLGEVGPVGVLGHTTEEYKQGGPLPHLDTQQSRASLLQVKRDKFVGEEEEAVEDILSLGYLSFRHCTMWWIYTEEVVGFYPLWFPRIKIFVFLYDVLFYL